jgi:o-succinylbenzoate synthase
MPDLVISSLDFRPYAIPLVRPWRMAGRAFADRRGWVVAISTAVGMVGYGDCAPLPAMGTEDDRAAAAALKSAARMMPTRTVEGALAGLGWAGTPAARCALETALLDLLARKSGLSLARYLAADAADEVAVNAAIGGLDDGCPGRAAAALAAGFRVAKVKVGLAEDEGPRLCRLCASLGDRLRLRLDANGAWDEAAARRFLATVAHLPLDGLEEPLDHPTLPALQRLQAEVGFPLAVDESLGLLGPDALIASGAVRRLVVKPVLLGGLLPARTLAQKAGAAGLQVVVTSAIDTAIGVTAAAHLAASLEQGPAHGLATLDWLAADVAPRPTLSNGRLRLPVGFGLGIVPSDEIS